MQTTPTPDYEALSTGIAAWSAGVMLVSLLVTLVVLVISIWLFWRIFTKAGLSGALSLLQLIPGIGAIIMIFYLAFAEWPSTKK